MTITVSMIVVPSAARPEVAAPLSEWESKLLEIKRVAALPGVPLARRIQGELASARGVISCVVAEEVFFESVGKSVSEFDDWIRLLTDSEVDLLGFVGATRFPANSRWRAGEPIEIDDAAAWERFPSPRPAARKEPARVVPAVCLAGPLLLARKTRFLEEPFDVDLSASFPLLAVELSLRWLLRRRWRLGLVENVLPATSKRVPFAAVDTELLQCRYGGFLPLDLGGAERWQANLAAMERVSPVAAARLGLPRPPGKCIAFEPRPSARLLARAPGVEKELADPNFPAVNADEPAAWIFQGAGTGMAIDTILKNTHQAVVVVEPEGHLVHHLLSRFDWSVFMHAGRLAWHLPLLATPELAEVSLQEIAARLDALARQRMHPLQWHSTGSEPLHHGFHESLRLSLASHDSFSSTAEPFLSSAVPEAPEILVVRPNCAIFEDLTECFQRLGCRVLGVNIPDRAEAWNTELRTQFVQLVARQGAGVTLFRNRALLETNSARARACLERALPGRLVSWWWDVPNVASMLDYEDPAAQRPAYGFARELLPLLPRGSQWLPPAARMAFVESPFADIPPEVCQSHSTYSTKKREPENHPDAGQSPSILLVGQSRFDQLRAHSGTLANGLAVLAGSPGRKLAEGLNRCSRIGELHTFLANEQLELRHVLTSLEDSCFAHAYYLDYLLRMCVTASYRLAAVERLAGLPLAIHGDDGWLRSKALAPEHYHGLVAPADLPALYARHALHLNLNFMQVASTVNPRVLDLAACGSAVITDDRPELSDLFPDPEARPFTFHALEELPDRVSDLLRRDLTEHRQRVRAVVLAKHTMLHRARSLATDLGLSIEKT